MGFGTYVAVGNLAGNQVIVIDLDGNVRVLAEGEAPKPGELIVQGNDQVSSDALPLQVEQVNEQGESQDITAELEDIFAALEDGQDPTQLGEDFATAAGGQTGSSLTASGSISRDGTETIASTDFATEGFQSLGLSETQSLALLEQFRLFEPVFVDLNNDPLGENLAVVTDEDTPISGTLVATDQNAQDILTFSQSSAPANGTVELDPATGEWTYTPNENYNGPDSFTVIVDDGNGGTDTLVVNIDVTPVNDAPVFVDQDNVPVGDSDAVTTLEDAPISGTVQATDVDGDDLTFSVSEQGANGTVTVDADGVWTYTPNEEYNGSDSFELTVSDGQGGTDTITIDVTVLPVAEMTVTAGESVVEDDSSYLEFTVSLDQAVTEDVPVTLTLGREGDSATKSVDYLDNLFVSDGEGGFRPITEDDLTIASGDTELRVFVQIIDDVETEETESITLIASSESEFVEKPNAQDTGEVTDDRGTRPDGRPGADEDAPNLIVTAL
ncbi:MAG: tandem-95 repeat protein, partial [Pseudomonadota bacterium]